MIKTLRHYNLWYVFATDSLYIKEKIVREVIDELTEIHRLKVIIYNNDQLILSVGNGFKEIRIELLFCDGFTQAFIENRYSGYEFLKVATQIDKTFGFWQDIMLSLFMECGLDYREDPTILDRNFSDAYSMEILAANSIRVLKEDDILSFFVQHSLPLPSKLFPNNKPNTQTLYQKIFEDKTWDIEYSLFDIRRLMEVEKDEPGKQEKVINPNDQDILGEVASLIIEGNNATFNFAGKSVTVKQKVGHLYLKYLFENPNRDVSALELYNIVGRSNMPEQEMEFQGMSTEISIDSSDDKTRLEILKRIEKLKEEINDYKRSEKFELANSKEEELEKLYLYLKENFNGMGNPRRKRPANEDNCRKAVCNAIKFCLKEFTSPKSSHDLLYDILSKKKALKFGFELRYNSPPGVVWKT